MKLTRILVALAALTALAVPVSLALSSSGPASAALAPIGWPGYHCTANHWMKDVSDGDQLLGVSPGGGLQLTDGAAGYPTDHVFVLCSLNGLYYLQNQIPAAGIPNGGRMWVGVNVGAHYALTDMATGPGPHEAFSIICTGKNQERIHWADEGSDMFTIATTPPTLWTSPPSAALPGTLYEISSVC